MNRFFLAAICLFAGQSAVSAALVPASGYVVARDGTHLYYEIAGSGPKTVLVSGGFINRAGLDPLTKRWRVVFYDARGRGRSDSPPPERVSLQHQVDDAADILDALQLEKVVVLGYSGMGKELFAFAMQHPERVERLVQVAPVPAQFAEFAEEMMAAREQRADKEALSELRARREAGYWAGDPAGYCRAEAAVANVMTFADPANVGAYPDTCMWPNEWPINLAAYFGALLPSVGSWDPREHLPAGLPRLVIFGEEDAIPAAAMKQWVEGDARACLIGLTGAAHWPFVEAADEFFRAVNAFIEGEWPPSCRQQGRNM